MKGYKAFNNDLTCRGMQYEIGKEYVFDGEPIPCRQGFHFCETIADCYEFYPMSDDMTDEEKENHPEHKTNCGFVKIFTVTTGAKTVHAKGGG